MLELRLFMIHYLLLTLGYSVSTRCCFVFLLSALSFAVQAQPNPPIRVSDDLGREVVMNKPAERIVALAPYLVEMVYAVGAGDKLVGAVNYSDYPEAAKTVAQVGNYKDFSVEAILRLKPDLVLAWESGNGRERSLQLANFGIPVYVSEPKRLEDIGRVLESIGRLSGAAGGVAAHQQFDQALGDLRKQFSRKAPVSVFYQIWNQPLQTLNGDHIISDVMDLCGGYNIFEGAQTLAPKVGVESVLRANPQVIITSGMGESRPDWLDAWYAWPQLQAVEQKQLHFIPPDWIQRHTPRILIGARLMCEQLQGARDRYHLGFE